jgi:hypothetical protein
METVNIKVVALDEIYNFAGKTFSFEIVLVPNIQYNIKKYVVKNNISYIVTCVKRPSWFVRAREHES